MCYTSTVADSFELVPYSALVMEGKHLNTVVKVTEFTSLSTTLSLFLAKTSRFFLSITTNLGFIQSATFSDKKYGVFITLAVFTDSLYLVSGRDTLNNTYDGIFTQQEVAPIISSFEDIHSILLNRFNLPTGYTPVHT